MPEIIDESNIRYIENGEPHDKEVYNRPTRDLLAETDDKLVENRGFAVSQSITYSIALG